jgi:ribosomal protein S18 acetylase RimI-like enzyme
VEIRGRGRGGHQGGPSLGKAEVDGMAFSVRRLGPEDGPVLELLAREDADFDLAGRGAPRRALSREAALLYLADAQLLHWVAESGGEVVGHLQCHLLRKWAGEALEVLLYEIGVRSVWRRQGVGRALVKGLGVWMKDAHIAECWVLADNDGAVAFYRACGFALSASAPTYMTLSSPGSLGLDKPSVA